MREPTQLTSSELIRLVGGIQQLLYLVNNKRPRWNPDKSWDGAEVLPQVAELLEEHGLVPEAPQSYTSPDIPKDCFTLYDASRNWLLSGRTFSDRSAAAHMASKRPGSIVVAFVPQEILCDCERPGYFYSGVPGILAHVENSKLAEGAGVERCDLCTRYASDADARQELHRRGMC